MLDEPVNGLDPDGILWIRDLLRGLAAEGRTVFLSSPGELRENEAFNPVLKLACEDRAQLGLSTGGEPDPAPSMKEQEADRAIMQRGPDGCARHGVTSIHNMDGNLYQLELLSQIEDAGGLHCRTRDSVPLQEFHDAQHA